MQVAQQREQAQVDPLQDDIGARDAGVLGHRVADREEPANHRGGVVAGHGHGPGLADQLVEHGQVIHDGLGGQRRAGRDEARILQAGPELLGLVVHAQRADHVDERPQVLAGEVLDQPEVQERDPAAAVEQVVARVRVPVERVHLVQAAEHEPVDRLPGQVTLLLRPGGQLGEPRAVGQLAGHHPPGGQLVDDPWHSDGGVPVVVVGQQPLVVGFAAVVELLQHPLAQLGHEPVHVLVRRGDLEHPAQQGYVVQVGGHGLGDAGVLDLHRHGPAVVGDRAVHLADGGGGDGLGIPLREHLLRRPSKLFTNNFRRQRRAHRRDAVL